MSKTGVSASIKNEAGSFNVLKPRYSSFKVGGIQIRGKNAATAQLIFMSLMLAWQGFLMMLQLVIWVIWLLFMVVMFCKEWVTGMLSVVRDKEPGLEPHTGQRH